MYFLTKSGLDDLLTTREELDTQRKGLRKQLQSVDRKTASYSRDGSTRSGHEEIQHDLLLVERQLGEKESIIRNCEVVESPTTTDRLQIVHIVTLQRFNENDEKIGAEERYLIGGYQSTDCRAKLAVLSYDAPIIAPFINKKFIEGHEPVPVHFGGKDVYVQLLKIEFLSPKGV